MIAPVLLPPEETPQRSLPLVVAAVAALGVAVLGLGLVPATLERRRLDRAHAELTAAVARKEAELDAWEHRRREAAGPSYLRELALRVLLSPPTAPSPAAARPVDRPPR